MSSVAKLAVSVEKRDKCCVGSFGGEERQVLCGEQRHLLCGDVLKPEATVIW